jgi:hypothetical protein
MAAALIPIITGLAPVVLPWIVKGVDLIFGPKTGDAKMPAALASLRAILEAAATAGKLPGPVPSDDALRVIIETVVQDLKSKGEMPTESKTTAAVPNQVFGGKLVAYLVQQ